MTALSKQIELAMGRYPNAAWRKVLHRAPLLLWRLGLRRLATAGDGVIVTTIGRRSGRPRYTPLSARHIDGTAYLWCPYGDRADWYLNVRAYPIVTVHSRDGTRTRRAIEVLDPAELRNIYRLLDDEHWLLEDYLDSAGLGHSVEDVLDAGRGLHALRLDPVELPGPPPLSADMAWIWVVPAALVVGGITGVAARRLRKEHHRGSRRRTPTVRRSGKEPGRAAGRSHGCQ